MGDVVISLDAELAWGYHDRPSRPTRMRAARGGWVAALELFDQYEVPATWAVVGHLFLGECDGCHADHPLGREWFEDDPGGSAEGDGLWYAPEFVDAIAGRAVGHELACHSFSHVEFGDDRTTEAVAEREVEACLRAADRRGVSLDSFVFPRNRVGHRAVLADHGFMCYRGGRPKLAYEDSRLRQVAKVADCCLGLSMPPVVTPTVDEHGLVDVPASLYLFSFEGLARSVLGSVWHEPVTAIARRGIDSVADGDGVFHMWLHPHNLLQPGGLERMADVLAYLDRKRQETDIEVRTMRAVAEEYRGEADAGLQEVAA